MKKLFSIFLTVAVAFSLSACGNQKEKILITAEQETAETSEPIVQQESNSHESGEHTVSTNILVAYFSRTGTTEPLAQYAAEYLNADILEIEAAVPYTDEDIAYYTDCRADREQNDKSARPEIAGTVSNMDQYDTIILGYPIWHGQAPRIIDTFMESYDFDGKTIVPFCTSHSSPIGSSDTYLHGLCNAEWIDGKRFAANGDTQAFAEWLSDIVPNHAIRNEDPSMAKELTLMVDGTVIPVIWEDNASVAELSKLASGEQIKIAMSMYGGWEQVGPLGHSVSKNDVRMTADNGDIMLYSGNQIVLFYGENTWEYTKLGHIDLPSEDVTALLGSRPVNITLAVQ